MYSTGNRLSFGDTNKVYSRLEAMKVAKEQSKIREEAANYAKDASSGGQARFNLIKVHCTAHVQLELHGVRRGPRP